MAGISILRRLLMKQAMKESAPFQHEGIMSISRSLSGNVDTKVKRMVESAKRQGIDFDKYTEQEIKYILELNKPKAPKVYSNEEAYEILNRFVNRNKRGEVVKADFGKPFSQEVDDIADKKLIEQMYRTSGPRSLDEDAGYLAEFIAEDAGKVLDDLSIKEQTKFIERAKNALRKNVKQYQPEEVVTVESVVTDIKKLDPIESMKEANKVLRGEGRYKSLSKADREKIVDDESVTDHIFERNIGPEDLAQGGRAGLNYLLAEDTNERMPYVFGGRTIGVLKNLLSKMKKSHGIPRGEKSLKSDRFAKSIMSEEDKLRLLQLETGYANSILESLKADRQLFKQLQVNKEMKDQGLDFLMKHFVDTQTPHMKNYKSLADIDQAILELETLVKNKTLKEGRQLNAEGGRIGYAGGGSGKPPINFYANFSGSGNLKQENYLDVPGLTQRGYNYGGSFGADTTLPLFGGELTVGGNLGIGRDKSNVDYKGQPIDWLSNVGETKLGDDWNVGLTWRKKFAAGGMGRRAFLKLMAALGATGVAAKSGLVTLLGKGGKKQVAKELTQVPIKNIKGMPTWFKPLVNKVIKEGDDVTKKYASVEREIVHKTELPDSKTDVYVTQDLNTGNVTVDIGMGKHGFGDGHLGQPVTLNYKASELIEPPIVKKGKVAGHGKGTKTKEEFWVEEAEFTGGHPENVKFEESVIEKFGDHGSNFDEVEMFATGKVKKSKPLKKREATQWAEGRAEAEAQAIDDADDFASGGLARMLGE